MEDPTAKLLPVIVEAGVSWQNMSTAMKQEWFNKYETALKEVQPYKPQKRSDSEGDE